MLLLFHRYVKLERQQEVFEVKCQFKPENRTITEWEL